MGEPGELYDGNINLMHLLLDKTVVLNKHLDWPMSQGVVEVAICKETYEKATRFCSATKEIYLKENRPRQMCQKHSSPFSRFKDK